MATRYEVACDRCSKITQSLGEHPAFDDKEVAKNNWRLSLSNHWIEEKEGGGLLQWDHKLDYEICLDCAKEATKLFEAFLNWELFHDD